jgi:hypothetical protein
MVVATGYLYVTKILEGRYDALSKMVSAQLVFAVFLIFLGYKKRNIDPLEHRTNMILANLWMIQPAMDRWVDHIFPSIYLELWLAVYIALFAAMIWYYRRIPWQLWVGVLIWLAGLLYAINENDF